MTEPNPLGRFQIKPNFSKDLGANFCKLKSVANEKGKFFTSSHEPNEPLEMLHAALTAQAARSELGTLDLFISRMKNVPLQATPAFETLAAEKVLKRAERLEHIVT